VVIEGTRKGGQLRRKKVFDGSREAGLAFQKGPTLTTWKSFDENVSGSLRH